MGSFTIHLLEHKKSGMYAVKVVDQDTLGCAYIFEDGTWEDAPDGEQSFYAESSIKAIKSAEYAAKRLFEFLRTHRKDICPQCGNSNEGDGGLCPPCKEETDEVVRDEFRCPVCGCNSDGYFCDDCQDEWDHKMTSSSYD